MLFEKNFLRAQMHNNMREIRGRGDRPARVSGRADVQDDDSPRRIEDRERYKVRGSRKGEEKKAASRGEEGQG